jgi:hypothetical protein
LNEKLDVLNKKKHDLVQMLKQVLFSASLFFWLMSVVIVFAYSSVELLNMYPLISHGTKFMIYLVTNLVRYRSGLYFPH